MSYEVVAIDSPTGAAPAQSSQPIMREERVLTPYQIQSGKATIGQYDKIERQAPEESRSSEETVKLSPGAAALAKRELKFRQQQQALQKERAAVEAQKAEISQLRAMKEKLAAKDYSGLEGLVDYNDYSQYQVNKLQTADPNADQINQIRSKTESLEKMMQDNIEAQFNAAVAERRTATAELVGKSDQFPAIKKAGAQANEAVVQHILDTWEHDSKELTIEQAAKEVETILLEKAKQWSSLLEPKEDLLNQLPDRGMKKTLPLMNKSGLKTLTNQVTATALNQQTKKPYHSMSDAERWAEARRRAMDKLQTR